MEFPRPNFLTKRTIIFYNSTQMAHSKYLPPATKLRQGNVFTSVCDSVHGGGLCMGVSVWGVWVSVQWGPCQGDTPAYGYMRAVPILLQCNLVVQ